jgi:hypothetical protein
MLTRIIGISIALAAGLVLFSLTGCARGDEPCWRDGCPLKVSLVVEGQANAMPSAKLMPKADGPTVVYVAPAGARVLGLAGRIAHAIKERMYRAACEVKVTMQTFEAKQPVRTFVREHRPVKNWQARRCGCW